ncbi:hypothetical protein BPY_02860 [Bifidobacterium psychraerophilum]
MHGGESGRIDYGYHQRLYFGGVERDKISGFPPINSDCKYTTTNGMAATVFLPVKINKE